MPYYLTVFLQWLLYFSPHFDKVYFQNFLSAKKNTFSRKFIFEIFFFRRKRKWGWKKKLNIKKIYKWPQNYVNLLKLISFTRQAIRLFHIKLIFVAIFFIRLSQFCIHGGGLTIATAELYIMHNGYVVFLKINFGWSLQKKNMKILSPWFSTLLLFATKWSQVFFSVWEPLWLHKYVQRKTMIFKLFTQEKAWLFLSCQGESGSSNRRTDQQGRKCHPGDEKQVVSWQSSHLRLNGKPYPVHDFVPTSISSMDQF